MYVCLSMSTNTHKKPDVKRMFAVRLPDHLHDALHRRAEQDRRSIVTTTEIVIQAGLAELKRNDTRQRKSPT